MINELRINVTSVNPLKDDDLLSLLPDSYNNMNGNDSLSKKELDEIDRLSKEMSVFTSPYSKKVPNSEFKMYKWEELPEDIQVKVTDIQNKINKVREPLELRQKEFQRVSLKKACGIVRGILAAIAEYLPRAGVVIRYDYEYLYDIPALVDANLISEISPFRVYLVHYGASKDNKKDKVTVEDIIEEERE